MSWPSKTTPPPKMTARRFVAPVVAADYAGVSTKTIRRWISDGRLNGYRAGTRLIRVDLNELDAMISPIPTGGDAA